MTTFFSRYRGYRVQITPERSVDFVEHRFTTDDEAVIEALRKNWACGIDFWEEKFTEIAPPTPALTPEEKAQKPVCPKCGRVCANAGALVTHMRHCNGPATAEGAAE